MIDVSIVFLVFYHYIISSDPEGSVHKTLASHYIHICTIQGEMRFVVNEVELEQVFIIVFFRFSPTNQHSTISPYTSITVP